MDVAASRAPRPATDAVWVRAVERITGAWDDPVTHAAVLACVSDLCMLHTATRPHGGWPSRRVKMLASLDHAMWFHAAFRADEWLLCAARGARVAVCLRRGGSLDGSLRV